MGNHTRHASLQMRVYIGLCVFILVATLPLHFYDLPVYQMFNLNVDKSGKIIQNPFYLKYDRVSHTLEIRYQNQGKLPEKLDSMGCEITVLGKNSSVFIAPKEISLAYTNSKRTILTLKAQSNKLKQYLASKNKSNLTTQEPNKRSANDAKNSPNPKIKKLDLHGHNITIQFSYNDKPRAIFIGVINTRNNTIDQIKLNIPDID